VQAVGVDAGQVEPKLNLLRPADGVHPDAGTPGDAVELRERVEGGEQHVLCLPVCSLPEPDWLGFLTSHWYRTFNSRYIFPRTGSVHQAASRRPPGESEGPAGGRIGEGRG